MLKSSRDATASQPEALRHCRRVGEELDGLEARDRAEEAYARGAADRSAGLDWEHVPYSSPANLWYNSWAAYVGAPVIVAALMWLWLG